jgi:L-lactate dehydrogenase complex protein LldG
MSSRDKILATVKKNQPELRQLPMLPAGAAAEGVAANEGAAAGEGVVSAFIATVEAIGGSVYIVSGLDRIDTILREKFPGARRIVNVIAEKPAGFEDPHTLENVDLAILPAHFGVAENGACWVTEAQMIERALPFITQHLALVLRRESILPDMHAAYERIAGLDAGEPYGFATFIAGPSKTADIEQSLVLGAHGPASLTVFLLDEEQSDAGYY